MKRLICAFFAAVALLGGPVSGQQAGLPNPMLRAADHVLVWSQKSGEAEAVFEGLGFNVRRGQTYPEGIASSTVTFADWSYVELLHFADASSAVGSVQAMQELSFVRQAPGANSFAIQVSDVELAADWLMRRGLAVDALTPDIVDPDGPSGPEPQRVASWRDFHLAKSQASGADIFFIQYPPDSATSDAAKLRFQDRVTHRNSARRLSAIWVLVDDLDGEAVVYRKMGFRVSDVRHASMLNARVRVAQLGSGAVVLAQSEALPDAFVLPGRPGARVLGLSFEVDSLPAATAAQATASQIDYARYPGPFGPSLLVQLTKTAGLFVEFHERSIE